MSKFDEWRKKAGEANNSAPETLYVNDKDRYPTSVNHGGVVKKRNLLTPREILLLRDWITDNFDN